MISSARTSRLVALAATTVIGLTVATAVPSYADSRMLKDGTGDTWDITQDEPVEKGGHPEADVRRVVVRHTTDQLVVRIRTQDLRKTGRSVGATIVIRAAGTTYHAAVFGEKGAWKGNSYFAGRIGCESDGTLDYQRDVMTYSVPTSCFGSTDWVKVKVSGVLVTRRKAFYDSATSDRAGGGFTRRIDAG